MPHYAHRQMDPARASPAEGNAGSCKVREKVHGRIRSPRGHLDPRVGRELNVWRWMPYPLRAGWAVHIVLLEEIELAIWWCALSGRLWQCHMMFVDKRAVQRPPGAQIEREAVIGGRCAIEIR